MDGRGGCCIARYAGGGAYDMSKVDQIMLRFRPIAPKPAAAGGGGSSSVSGGPTSPDKSEAPPGRCGRGKRRSPRRDGSGRGSRKRKAPSPPDEKKDPPAVTLPLLPDAPVGKARPAPKPESAEVKKKGLPIWMSFGSSVDGVDHRDEGEIWSTDRTAVMAPQAVRVVGSCVTVECVTDTWTAAGCGFALGSTDEERRMVLERDSCPGFVTDAWNRVTWTNGAYRRMVAAAEEGEEEEEHGGVARKSGKLVVWVVAKERVPWAHVGFTCRVRVRYTTGGGGGGGGGGGKERRGGSVTVPCDAWRMDGGGFAWRLDVDAALSLGR